MCELTDIKKYPGHMQMDYIKHNDNVKNNKKLCPRCDGTGNEFFNHYRRCSACNGTGIKE